MDRAVIFNLKYFLFLGYTALLFLFQGNANDLPEDENTPEKRVNKIFKMMDKVRCIIMHLCVVSGFLGWA